MGHVRCPEITSDHVSQPQFSPQESRPRARGVPGRSAWPRRRLRTRRLEELDRVAGGIFEQDLLPSRAGDDVVAEVHPFGSETLDLGRDVVHHELESVPAARLRLAAVRHGPPGRAGRAAEQQSQVAPEDVSEGRYRVGAEGEAEALRVEVHGGIDIVDHVADVDCFLGHVPHLLAGRSSTLSVITDPRGYSPLEAFQHPGHVVLESVAYLLALEPGLQHREKGRAVPFLERDGHRGVHTASPLAAEDRLPEDEAARIVDLGEYAGFAIRLRAPPPVNNGPRAANTKIEIRFDERAPLSSELGPSIEERVKDRLGWSVEQPVDPQLVPHVVSEAACRSDRSRVPR